MKPYGILRVCRVWRLARYTVQRDKAQTDAAPGIPAKRGPKTFLSDDALLAESRAVLASNLFVGEGHRKVRPRLRHDHGVRTSMRRVLRIMRELGTPAQDRPTGALGPETHDRAITTAKPDEMWAIDATGCLNDEKTPWSSSWSTKPRASASASALRREARDRKPSNAARGDLLHEWTLRGQDREGHKAPPRPR
jgi:hypothetical protein